MVRGLAPYASLLWVLAFAVAGVLLVYLVHRLTAVAPDALTSAPFLSGHAPDQHALSRYHVRWYPMSMIFLAFDIEMLFMYPWALVVLEEGLMAVVEMFLFLGILLVGVAWVWREGALRWV